FRNVNATAALQRPFAGGRLRINGLIAYDTHEYENRTTIISGSGVDELSAQDVEEWSGELGLTWNRKLGERTELELTGLQRSSSSDYVGDYSIPGFTSTFGEDATQGESIARAVVRFRRNERWSFESGGEVAYNFLDSSTTYEEDGVAVPLPSASVKVEELRGEAFGQTTWRPSPKLTVEAGLRVEVSEISQSGDSDASKSFIYPKPRVQATWTPKAGHQFRARYEREVGQLDFGDFVASSEVDLGQVTGGNPDLEPYKSDLFEAVYERRFWGEGVFEVTLRHTEFTDLVDTIPLVGGVDGVGNIGDGSQDWSQLRLALPLDKLGLSNARLQARASWAESSVIDPVTGEERRFSGNTPFGCGVTFTQDLRGGRWGYGVDHGCNVDKFHNYRTREDRYFEQEPFVTLFGQWKPSSDLTVRVDLGNVTDRENRRYRDVFSGPRGSSPLVYREEQGTKMSPWLFIQVRKTL
ncbi:MAG: TonB-dependent receptor domain-containing protein, partial [Brevundimonas sp.]